MNFKFYFPGARHDGRAVFGGYEAAERAEFLGGRGDRYTAGLLRKRGTGEKERRKRKKKKERRKSRKLRVGGQRELFFKRDIQSRNRGAS